LDIHFEYTSRNWVLDSTTGDTYIDAVATGADTPLFDRTLISRMLKLKYLEAKNLDTTKAQADFNQIFQLLTSHDKGSRILSAGRSARNYPYLNAWNNVADSGFGS